MNATTPTNPWGIPDHLRQFEPSQAAALARLRRVQPAAYARTRNALDGAVTGLSPYFTHGMLSLADAARSINVQSTALGRAPLGFDDKLVFEFGWREFFHHVWQHAANQGDAILRDMHSSPPWPGKYADTVPDDIRQGRTGVPAIDSTVRTLYATGYLHNHTRMWLASYMVHVRKVHWRAGADWLYGHLLDGDLPSNHLSWQWVAGTLSGKPYLFNADNVLKFAPATARKAWASPHTVLDTSYEDLEDRAQSKAGAGPERGAHAGVEEPALAGANDAASHESFVLLRQAIQAPFAIETIANKHLELVHPWALSPRRAESHDKLFRLGIIHLPAHAHWPWSARRWQFVLQAMADVTDAVWIGDLGSLDLSGCARATTQATQFPGYREALGRVATLSPAPRLLPKLPTPCRSFSKFYQQVQRDVDAFADLL